MYLFSNILGVFVFDEKFNVIDKALFNGLDDYKNKGRFIEEIRSRHRQLSEPDEKAVKRILAYFKEKGFFDYFYSQNLKLTKFNVKNSVTADILIIQSSSLIDELDKAANLLAKRLREWYGLHNPEFSKATASHEQFAEAILERDKNELLKELQIAPEDSIGADLGQEDVGQIRGLSQQIHDLYQLRKAQEDYISALMNGLCPNIKAVCGAITAAKLIAHAGSLKRLSEMPASTIQILGAEQALFRHMKTGAKPPRHGVIVHHPLIAKAPDRMHGKIARALADKISIASKVDYFQGQFIGDKLRKELEKKFE